MSDETTRRTFLAACAAGISAPAEPVRGQLKSWRSNPVLQPLAAAFEYLESGAWKPLADGKHPIDGDRLFASLMHADTHPAAGSRFEAHRQYIDIHYLVSGAEMIGYAPAASLTVVEDYREKDDVMFYALPREYTRMIMKPAQFAVFFAGQPHLPGCQAERPGKIRKVVMKIHV